MSDPRKVIQDACDEALRIHKFGAAAVMVTRALRDHGWEIVRSSGSAAQNQEQEIDVALLDDAIFALSHKRMQTGMERLARVRERLVERAARSQNQEEPDERALDTPLGARQRAQTQRDVADILQFGSPQDEDQ